MTNIELQLEELDMILTDLKFSRMEIDKITQRAQVLNSSGNIRTATLIATSHSNRRYKNPICYISANGSTVTEELKPIEGPSPISDKEWQSTYEITFDYVGMYVCYSFQGKLLKRNKIKLENDCVILKDI